jgi:actin-like ATPase involved in cell morphogenesis
MEGDMVEENDDKNVLDDLLQGANANVDPHSLGKLITKVDELKESGKNVESQVVSKKAYGLDIGTSRMVSIKQDDQTGADQLNAFIAVSETQFLRDMLVKSHMAHTKIKDEIAVLGYDALQFANIFNSEIRRPMKQGLITSEEIYAIPVMKEIINLVLPRATEMAQPLCFSVPAPAQGFETGLVFHEGTLKRYLMGLGYKARSINEGMAVVVSELADENFTGIGISMGAGMCNICFSFLSVPVLVFSIARGGDDVDTSVARMMHETVNRVRVIKEESLDFSRTPKSNLENALIIYYEDLIRF